MATTEKVLIDLTGNWIYLFPTRLLYFLFFILHIIYIMSMKLVNTYYYYL